MSSEMRECPFCGNQPRSGWQGTGVPGMDDCGYWGIDCCNAFAHADTEAEALAQWNRRSDAPNGSWLWCKLMDFCQKRRFPPAEFNDLFAIVTEAHELNNRALLARTEAGADEPVAWVSKDDPMFGDSWIATTPMLFSIKEPELAENLVPLYTHPQDASGDAERHELLRQVYGMAREGCESPMAGYRWCERIDELFHAGKPSDEYAEYASDLPDAMQAKEAK